MDLTWFQYLGVGAKFVKVSIIGQSCDFILIVLIEIVNDVKT